MGSPTDQNAEAWASRIRQTIQDARKAGVNVTLDWTEDEDGIHVSLYTTVHERHLGHMKWVQGPFLVEGY